MKRPRSWRLTAVALAGALAVFGCTGTEQPSGPTVAGMIDYLDFGDFGGGSNPQANYNPYLEGTNLGAVGYVFEPLVVFDNYNCIPKPWLASEYAWTDPRTLRFTLRDGVTWNDGQPFTAEDVAFSFNLIKEHRALDTKGVWRYLRSVVATDPRTVTMTFAEPGASAFTLVTDVRIVPKHIWSTVADPVTFTNAENPVGTGPFTVKSFNPQQLTIARNPGYWQADKVKVEEIRFHKADGGGQIDQLKLSRGEYDHNAMFVPDIKKAYVDRDPEFNHYWYPPGGTISLYLNLTRAPFDDVAFRRALTTAVNRPEIADKAQLGYVTPASQSGLVVPGQAGWLPSDIPNQGVIGYDPAKADAALTAAGYPKDAQGRRLGKDGKPIEFTFKVPGSWTDWVQAAKIVVENLTALGFRVDLQTPTPEAYEADRAIGSYDALFGVHGGSCNMFRNFQEPLASDQSAPIGQKAASNFVRWTDPRTDQLIAQLRVATDEAAQKAAVAELARIMMDQVPMIPLWYGAKWFQYRTKKAVGWPNEKNPYAAPSDNLLIITNLRPAGS
ncbi:ABC transporter substrate-binding protein [Micromonospora sp. HM5-17]|uniref:ABC transporter substrate-binding protein n=1 Tax=Micromonospora sp. HM5-17 TaxID=2487710 RepID=UPI000F47EF07|nr:ABC transporter substrate-binding protein [Micromonospora sp. HM5-17]ROT28190.1 ABC transporter substrate-binding protein [Micromonospora sp. HM5-17]